MSLKLIRSFKFNRMDKDIEQTKQLVKKLQKIGHIVPLNILSLLNLPKSELGNVKNLIDIPIRSAPFSELLQKRLFGIQEITECSSCKNYFQDHKSKHENDNTSSCYTYGNFNPLDDCDDCVLISTKISNLNLTEHDIIKEVLSSYISIDFLDDDGKKELINDCDSYELEVYDCKDIHQYKKSLDDNKAELHPRLWLFIGDTVLSFKTYLLFNSDHGHPQMDNWNLVEWNLTQPPATDKIKLIGNKINNIKLYDDEHDIRSHNLKANYDKWVERCGITKDDFDVPTDSKLYPIIRIDTDTKMIGLGARWFWCCYPQSVWYIFGIC